jgi:tRNA U34 5-methylaminomethyl-2-thiouridine-forming methyltransferase MnmC
VFIEAGLLQMPDQKELNLLEVGLGTGLNAFMTFLENNKNSSRIINYTALEAFPLDETITGQLNFPEKLNASEDAPVFMKIHNSAWNGYISLGPNFNFKKILGKLESVEFSQQFDLIYFDAFGPAVQPELWTEEIFQKIAGCMNEGAVLVTYCAKGEVKRNMKKAGLSVEGIPGPPGKREMIRARKKIGLQ